MEKYSGLLEREYTENREEGGIPTFFTDLNLNQIVRELQDKAKEYKVRGMYHVFPKDYETVCYRQEIYRDIRGKHLEPAFASFAKKMRETREYKERSEKAEDRYQRRMYGFNAVSEYTNGVDLLRKVLIAVAPESEGLQGLRVLLDDMCETKLWRECRKEKEAINEMLTGLRFEVSIDGTNLRVRTRKEETHYFDRIKRLFPQKFSEKVSDKPGEEGLPADYLIRSPFAANERLSFLEEEIVKLYKKIRPDFFEALDRFQEAFGTLIDEDLYRIEEEMQYYLVFSEFQTDMENHGCIFCEPEVRRDRVFRGKEVYDPALARKHKWADREVVSNSFEYRDGEKFFVVTGPNQGGKTTFARSLGQLVYFAMMGLNVPAEAASVPYFETLLTHFSVEESLESGRGKLKEELVRLKPMMEGEQSNCFVILNELFTTAATYDAFVMGQRVIRHFSEAGCLGVYVTHIAELTKAGDDVVSLVALADEKDHKKRTFRIVRKEAEGTGYAVDIVDKHRLGYEELCKRLEEGGLTICG